MVVIDASALLELLLRTPAAPAVDERVLKARRLCAPYLLDLEVTNVLRRYYAAGEMSSERAREAFADFRALRIDRYAHELLLARVWDLRHNVTAYDAVYLALAEALGAPLLTCDARLARVPGHGAVVEVLPDR